MDPSASPPAPAEAGPASSTPAAAAVIAGTVALTLDALGVVFGDIGTSPLYAVQRSSWPTGPPCADTADVYGVISLVSANSCLLSDGACRRVKLSSGCSKPT